MQPISGVSFTHRGNGVKPYVIATGIGARSPFIVESIAFQNEERSGNAAPFEKVFTGKRPD